MDNFMDALAERYHAQEMIAANSQAELARKQSLQEQVEAYEAVLQEMRKLNFKNTELTEKMHSLVDESIEKVRDLQVEAANGGISIEDVTHAMDESVQRALKEAYENMKPGETDDLIFTALEEIKAAVKEGKDAAGENRQAIVSDIARVSDAQEKTLERVEGVNGNIETVKQGTETIYQAIQELRSTLLAAQGSLETIHQTQVTMAETEAQQDRQSGKEEFKQMFGEIYGEMTQAQTQIRNLQTLMTESSNGVKSALDTGIYGVRQDNREIIGYIRQLSEDVLKQQEDGTAEDKAEEEKAQKAEERRLLEEHFKATEDFMHKESVKVYRNVQAVLNEKSEKQTESIEDNYQTLDAKLSQVKIISLIAAVVGSIDLIINILGIFGVL